MKAKNTLDRLKAKANSSYGDKVKMPSIRQISGLLKEYGIRHEVNQKTNIVEYRSKGKCYVNSRYAGKTGLALYIPDLRIELDTSSSYYSWNTWRYAREIIDMLEQMDTKQTPTS